MEQSDSRDESTGVTKFGPNQPPHRGPSEPTPFATNDVDSDFSDGLCPGEVTLRQWLSRLGREVDRFESLHIFRQVLDFVDLAHMQGVLLRNIRPSCFLLSPLNRVAFIDSPSTRSSSDRSPDHSPGRASTSAEERYTGGDVPRSHSESMVEPPVEASGSWRPPNRPEGGPRRSEGGTSRQEGAVSVSGGWIREWSGSSASDWCGERRPGMRACAESSEIESSSGKRSESESGDDTVVRTTDHRFPQKQVLLMEQTWYTSPEELTGGTSIFSSDIYRLGVLMFELFCTFESEMERTRVMADLRHRILPPHLLSECPKEASFCLWLLHPEPSSRPKARELLHCELLTEAGEALAERQAAVCLEEKETESEVLLDFLVRMEHQKQDLAQKLSNDVARLTSDIQEIERRRLLLKKKWAWPTSAEKADKLKSTGSKTNGVTWSSANLQERKSGLLGKRPQPEGLSAGNEKGVVSSDEQGRLLGKMSSKSARFMTNFSHLERVYFAMDWRAGNPGMVSTKALTGQGARSLSIGCSADGEKEGGGKEEDWLGCFFDGLSKYARYSRFEVRATLQHGDLLNTANMVCSLGFDRDEEFFATAGVCKRIKVFECDSVLNEHVDIHYPVVELLCRSKLSSVCWNGYIKSHLASCDYEGVVQLWDTSTQQVLMEYEEHEKRAWSVDFSRADPTKLASGSDDGTVKLWSINQESSVGTIKTKANVCCIQFPPDSGHQLAFGSADYKTYCYDLRTTRIPLCILASHNKAVSYVKFVDPFTLVSASTDNTLKLWDLTRANTNPGAHTACSLTYTGHTNEKNFIGLSVVDGYIACGSETNAVFAYHKSLPMEMASHKFGCTDPITGQETEEDVGQFVSSVCWRGRSQTLVAANSLGNIKVLEMV